MLERKKLIEGYLAAGATLVCWTCFSLITRMGGKSPLTPWDIFALRLITATLVLLPFGGLPAGAWRDRRLWLLTVLSSLLYCPLAYSGFKLAPAAHGAILLSGMQPFLISSVAWLLFRTIPSRMRLLGLILISTGIGCAAMLYFNAWSPQTAFGDLLIFLSSVSWAFYGVLSARWGYSAWTLTRAIAFGPAVVFLPIYFLWLPKGLAEAPLSAIVLQCVFQGIVATILAMLAYLKAMECLGAERTAAFLALVPITAGLIAVPLLDEPLSGWLLAGLVFVSSGSYIASRYGSSGTRPPTLGKSS